MGEVALKLIYGIGAHFMPNEYIILKSNTQLLTMRIFWKNSWKGMKILR
jgi:hypothetical protein